ncbi:hypothetical protein [uncultured Lacinutrix sp.]|uniref:hypothetical protein n=1 Tax=uncultured Lacinutrix sp. TaxID=574032 RepID=UPI002608D168|nr:hypothetical protein [uncultured Lacinutrix sp.]
MNYKDLVSINIKLDNTKYNIYQPIIGVLEIKNNSDVRLELDGIKLELLLRHKGKGETDSIVLENTIIKEYKSINVNQTIVLDFSFSPVNNVSYNGYNVTQAILLKTKVDINKETEKLLRNNKLSKLKIGSFFRGIFKPDFYDEVLIKVIKANANYKINSASGLLKPGKSIALAIIGISFVVCLIGGLLLYKNFDNKTDIIYGVIALFLAIFVFTYFYKLGPSLKVGDIKFKLNNIEGNFYEAVLNFEKRNQSIKEISAQLLGVEKVTYDNGSSRSTAKHTFYESKPHIIKGIASSVREAIELPKDSLPISIINNDFEILWKFKIVALTHNNLTLSGSADINIGFEKNEVETVKITGVDFS